MALGLSDFLVDTDILIYAYDAAEQARRSRCIDVLQALVTSGRGVLTTQVLGEFYSRATRERPGQPQILDPATAAGEVDRLIRFWPILDFGSATVIEAIAGSRRYRLSYYDALIWATAKQHGVSRILSEDRQNGQVLEGVRIMNPLLSDFDLALLD